MWKVIETDKFNGQAAYEVVRVNGEGRETFRMCAVYADERDAQRIADYWEQKERGGRVLKIQ